MRKTDARRHKKTLIIALLILAALTIGILIFCRVKHIGFNSQKVYTAKELGITDITTESTENADIPEIESLTDADQDGINDYRDIMEGARAYVNTKPDYKSEYYEGGYPTDGKGVCTDVIWEAFQAAGYDLKALVDEDIKENLGAYEEIDTPDPNIDFRRVKNLRIFFERNATSLSIDFSNPEDWQPGDIVVFTKHIAICSDKRNKDGIPFIIHHDSLGAREANDMDTYKVVGHFRWEK